MTANDTKPDVDIEEMLCHEVPCVRCGRPARLRSMGHNQICKAEATHHPPFHRCITCYAQWLQMCTTTMAHHGLIWCAQCGGRFNTIKDFSDYREF